EDAAAVLEDRPLRIVDDLAVLVLHLETALRDPGLVEPYPGRGVVGTEGDDREAHSQRLGIGPRPGKTVSPVLEADGFAAVDDARPSPEMSIAAAGKRT